MPLHNLVVNCLQSNDAEIWQLLVKRLQPVFARIAYRVATAYGNARPDEVDDLVQESFLKLQALNKDTVQRTSFDSEQAALSYLKVLVANTVRDYFRNKTAEKRGALKTVCLNPLEEVAGNLAASPDRLLLISQINDNLTTDVTGRTIFWLYYRQGFTAKEIASIPVFKLSPKGVESLIRRLTIAVREKINPDSEGIFSRGAF